MKFFAYLARSLTNAYAYKCGLVVWVHSTPSAVIILRFPTNTKFIKRLITNKVLHDWISSILFSIAF